MATPAGEALDVLHSIFEDVSEDVLQIVLEANGYHLQRAIDALLEMQPDTQSNAKPKSGDGHGDGHEKIALPHDFLRPPSYFRSV